jgi:replication factor A1
LRFLNHFVFFCRAVICNDLEVASNLDAIIGSPVNVATLSPADVEAIVHDMNKMDMDPPKLDHPPPLSSVGHSSSSGFDNFGVSSRTASFGSSSNSGFGYQNNNSTAMDVDSDNPYKSFMSQGSGAVARLDVPMEDAVVPISMLNPYNNRWTIKARVTNKGTMRSWNNSKGSGKLFSVDLLDDQDGEIRATMFNDAADKFYDIFEQDRVYFISKGQVKLANKQFTAHLNSDYELSLNTDAEVVAAEDSGSIKKMKFSFESVEKIAQKPRDAIVDVLGVVTNVGPLSNILSQKTNREIPKRTITVADDSQHSVEITFWNTMAENHSDVDLLNAVIAIKGCRVSDFGGCSLSTLSASHLEVNPDKPEAHKLKGWWDSQGSSSNIVPVTGDFQGSGAKNFKTARQTIGQLKEDAMNLNDQALSFSVVATVTTLNYDSEKAPWYTACPGPKCNKKVSEDAQGNWYCEKCSKGYPNCEPRYILSLQTSDFTDSVWLRGFNEVAQQILGGHPASELKDLKDNGEDNRIESIFQENNFKTFQFTIRAKMENRMDQQRVAYSILRCQPVDNVSESNFLLEKIQEYGL